MENAKPITIAEFLAWEARQTTHHELIEGVLVAMSTPTKAHGRLVDASIERSTLRLATRAMSISAI